jgi:uncharacterized alpha-E superfamily protein
MLARTAENLFWLARYMERADYVARLIHVADRMANTAPAETRGSEWASAIIAAGCEHSFFKKYEEATADHVVHYLALEPTNPSSIFSCFETARRNARAVRIALTADMWDAVNSSWLELRSMSAAASTPERLNTFLDWTKERAGLFQGAYANSMLRNDAYVFTRLGHFLERADNTARILDVKYHVLLPEAKAVGGIVDYYQWAALLRIVSALRAYHVLYAGRITPWNVAEMMILRREMPRSLLYCLEQIVRQLQDLTAEYNLRDNEPLRLAGSLHSGLRYGRIQDIFQSGLHEFLTDFVDRTLTLGEEIATSFLLTTA